MPNISSEAWASIERDYGRRLAPEVRSNVDRVTATYIDQVTNGPHLLTRRRLDLA